MNKQECRKYIKKAYKRIRVKNVKLNIENMEYEMKQVLKKQMEEYIAYSKIAIHNMESSGNLEITLKDLLSQIDILPTIYSKYDAIDVANKL